jgi:hypothetical protein
MGDRSNAHRRHLAARAQRLGASRGAVVCVETHAIAISSGRYYGAVKHKEMSMAENNGQDGSSLDALLAKMPRIAEAVSRFPEAVQQQAFDALMAEAGGASVGTKSREAKEPQTRANKRTASRKKTADGQKTSRRSGGPKQLKDLDLAPRGKVSLKDFVDEKKPKTNHDRNVVSVYYCARILEVDAVTVDHVFTCYRDMNWRLPGGNNFNNSLALTASRKRFLDTSDGDNITLTSKGTNYVEHDLPPKAKEK